MKPLLAIARVLFALFVLQGAARAETPLPLADPTQPPAGVAGGGTATPGSVGLTSVMLPKKGGKPTAVIDGRTVSVGDMVGEARLVRLSETEAVMQGPGGVERLYLTPDVEKKTIVKGAARHKKDKP